MGGHRCRMSILRNVPCHYYSDPMSRVDVKKHPGSCHLYIFPVTRLYMSHVDLGAYLGKGTYWQFFHKLDSRENSLSNAANHFKIFLIEFEICLYEHLYFLYIRNPLFPIVAFIYMFWHLKVNMFYPKNSFPIV